MFETAMVCRLWIFEYYFPHAQSICWLFQIRIFSTSFPMRIEISLQCLPGRTFHLPGRSTSAIDKHSLHTRRLPLRLSFNGMVRNLLKIANMSRLLKHKRRYHPFKRNCWWMSHLHLHLDLLLRIIPMSCNWHYKYLVLLQIHRHHFHLNYHKDLYVYYWWLILCYQLL